MNKQFDSTFSNHVLNLGGGNRGSNCSIGNRSIGGGDTRKNQQESGKTGGGGNCLGCLITIIITSIIAAVFLSV